MCQHFPESLADVQGILGRQVNVEMGLGTLESLKNVALNSCATWLPHMAFTFSLCCANSEQGFQLMAKTQPGVLEMVSKTIPIPKSSGISQQSMSKFQHKQTKNNLFLFKALVYYTWGNACQESYKAASPSFSFWQNECSKENWM